MAPWFDGMSGVGDNLPQLLERYIAVTEVSTDLS